MIDGSVCAVAHANDCAADRAYISASGAAGTLVVAKHYSKEVMIRESNILFCVSYRQDEMFTL